MKQQIKKQGKGPVDTFLTGKDLFFLSLKSSEHQPQARLAWRQTPLREPLRLQGPPAKNLARHQRNAAPASGSGMGAQTKAPSRLYQQQSAAALSRQSVPAYKLREKGKK